MADLVIGNGRVVTSSGLIYGGLAIEGEKIIHKLREELKAEARRFELLHFERPEDRRYQRADKC